MGRNRLPWDVSPTFWDRYWSRVRKTKRCWLWTGATRNGYGIITIGGHAGKTVSVHRVAYEAFIGPIPLGLLICHHCDVRNCVRPSHLFAGSHADNGADMVAKDRAFKGERSWLEIATIPCPVCNKEFKPYRVNGRPAKRWCSTACSNRGRVSSRTA